MKHLLLVGFCLFVLPLIAHEENQNTLPKEIQIKTAVLPAPDADRDGAMVYGYNASGEFVVLRDGSNNLVCIGYNPNKEGISVSCYSAKLEPFMARGRELSTEGKDFKEKREIRGAEVAAGKISMPKEPSMTYIYYDKDENYNATTGALKDGQYRYVIYTQCATPESTGLPIKPHAKEMPWLMDPGTHRAQIMIGPFN